MNSQTDAAVAQSVLLAAESLRRLPSLQSEEVLRPDWRSCPGRLRAWSTRRKSMPWHSARMAIMLLQQAQMVRRALWMPPLVVKSGV